MRHKQVNADLATGYGEPVERRAGQKNSFRQARVGRQAYFAVQKFK